MPCTRITLSDGTVAIVCSRGRRSSQTCSTPGCGRAATKQCDYLLKPLAFGSPAKTCDVYLCDRCAVHVGPDRDLCRPHEKLEKARTP